MISCIAWIATICGFIGHGFNIYKNPVGLLIWVFGSALWGWHAVETETYSLLVSSLMSMMFTITAYLKWTKGTKNDRISEK